MFVNLDAMPTLIEDLSRSPMLIVIAGYAAFVPGLAIVYSTTDGRSASCALVFPMLVFVGKEFYLPEIEFGKMTLQQCLNIDLRNAACCKRR